MTVLTHQEAAAFLKVNEATLRKLRRRGEVHGTLVGAQYRYIREHLEAYLQGISPPNGSNSTEAERTACARSTANSEQVGIDQPRRPVHHRPFYSLNRRGSR